MAKFSYFDFLDHIQQEVKEGGGKAAAAAKQGRRAVAAASFDVSKSLVDDPVVLAGSYWGFDLSEDEVLKGAELESTHLTNRWVEVTKTSLGERQQGMAFSVHEFSFTAYTTVETVRDLLAVHLLNASPFDESSESFKEDGRTRWYEHVERGPHGLCLQYELVKGAAACRGHVHVRIPGQACEMVGMAPIQNLLRHLNEMGIKWRPTRVDLAFDGHGVSPRPFYDAIKAGNVRTRVKLGLKERTDYEREKKVSTHSFHENEFGETAYLGARSSEKMLRCYNERGYNRLELELKGRSAESVGLQLVCAPLDQWAAIGMGWLRRHCDLVDAKAQSNITRCALLDFWSEFVSGFEHVKPLLQAVKRRVLSSVQRCKTYGKCAVKAARNFRYYLRILGEDYMQCLVGEAAGVDDDRRVQIAEAKSLLECVRSSHRLSWLWQAANPDGWGISIPLTAG